MPKAKPNGLTAREILAKTPSRTRVASRYVTIETAEPKVLRGGFAALRCKARSTHDPDGKPKAKSKVHTLVLYATEPNVRLHQAKLKVTCSCEAHVFWGGEYALWRHGAADLKYGNGDPPTDRNPKLIPWACKHLTRALELTIRKKV